MVYFTDDSLGKGGSPAGIVGLGNKTQDGFQNLSECLNTVIKRVMVIIRIVRMGFFDVTSQSHSETIIFHPFPLLRIEQAGSQQRRATCASRLSLSSGRRLPGRGVLRR